MTDITNNFGTLYHPVKALLLYQRKDGQNQATSYVESYDMDKDGCPINGHPLSIKEANALAKSLLIAEKKQRNFLNPKGLLSSDVVFLKTGNDGFALWKTPPQRTKLLFAESLDIPSGEAGVPALLWRAGKNSLSIFAILDEKVNDDTVLYHAPFFNVYADGKVCMGNVPVKIPHDCSLEDFMLLWQEYFFNSYFSHLFSGHMPVKGNMVQLWQKLIKNGRTFPSDKLVTNNIPLKKLIP